MPTPSSVQPQHAGWHLQEANEAVKNAHAIVTALEGAITNIVLPWTADSPQRLEAITLCQQRKHN